MSSFIKTPDGTLFNTNTISLLKCNDQKCMIKEHGKKIIVYPKITKPDQFKLVKILYDDISQNSSRMIDINMSDFSNSK